MVVVVLTGTMTGEGVCVSVHVTLSIKYAVVVGAKPWKEVVVLLLNLVTYAVTVVVTAMWPMQEHALLRVSFVIAESDSRPFNAQTALAIVRFSRRAVGVGST